MAIIAAEEAAIDVPIGVEFLGFAKGVMAAKMKAEIDAVIFVGAVLAGFSFDHMHAVLVVIFGFVDVVMWHVTPAFCFTMTIGKMRGFANIYWGCLG